MTPIVKAFIIGLFILVDIVATIVYIRYVKNKYPKLDYKNFELNPYIKFAWSKWGFDKGSLISPILMSPFLVMVILATLAIEHFFYMALGMYIVVMMLHFSNFKAIITKEKTPSEILYEKVYGVRK